MNKLIIAIAAAALSGAAMMPAAAQSAAPNAVANLNMSATPDLDRGGVRAVQTLSVKPRCAPKVSTPVPSTGLSGR